jgi:aspartate/methionine/tyrosine aminotransferase
MAGPLWRRSSANAARLPHTSASTYQMWWRRIDHFSCSVIVEGLRRMPVLIEGNGKDAMAATKTGVMRLAKRLDEVGFSDIVQIRNKVMELRAAGQKVFAFHGGEPFFDTPEVVKRGLFAATAENKTRYAPSSGIDPLRRALAEKLRAKNGMHVTHDDVIVTVGGAQGLYAAFQTVLDPGSDVLLFSPYWTPIRDMITAAESRPLFVSTAGARRNGITETLEQLTTANTRAIYYNTPQNPSGLVFSRTEAEEVAAFAIKHDLVVFADEAYEDLVYEGEHVSIASLPGMAERTISTFTFSKSYAMTGWRVGYAVAREPFMTGLKKMVLYGTNGVPTMLQCPWASLTSRRSGRSIASVATCWLRGSMPWGCIANCPPAHFTHFPMWPRSAKTAVRRQGCCWNAAMLRPFREWSSAIRARDMFGSATPPPWRRSKRAWSRYERCCSGRRSACKCFRNWRIRPVRTGASQEVRKTLQPEPGTANHRLVCHR